MNQRPNRTIRLFVAMFFLVFGPAALAYAQDQEKTEGPWYDVPALPHEKPWLQWVIGTVFGLACLAVALKNPHRTHLD